MKVINLVKDLQEIAKKYPDAEVRMNLPFGNPVMFALSDTNGNVWLEERNDFDVVSELRAQYKIAEEAQMDELSFFMEMLSRGFWLEDFKQALTEHEYEHAEAFMLKHGLI